MTPETIIKRMGLPIVEVDGRFQCPVCDYTQADYRLGPHMIKHWREAGVLIGTEPHKNDMVSCPIDACLYRTKRSVLSGHLVNVHDVERKQATAICRTLGFDLSKYFEHPPASRREVKSRDARLERDRLRKQRERAEAAEKGAALAIVELPASSVEVEPVTVEPDHTFADPPHWEAISGTDAALAVILGTANGYVATKLIPDIVNYVDVTRDLVAKLRER